MVSVIKHKRSVNTDKKNGLKEKRDSLVIALSLAVVFGLGWGFGLLATTYPSEAVTITFQVIFSLLVASQGILLFVLHGLRNTDARGVWKSLWISFATTTRLSYVITSGKTVTSTQQSLKVYSEASATLPRTLPRKVDLLKQEDLGLNSEAQEMESYEVAKIDLSEVMKNEGATDD